MSFTVVFPSQKKLSGSNGAALFNINWSFLDADCDHKVTMHFSSKSITADAQIMNQVYLVCAPNLGNRNCFIASNTTSTVSSNELGIIRPSEVAVVATSSYYNLLARAGDNPPIILHGRPSDNQFAIQIFEIDKSAIFVPSAHWVMILHFEKIEKVD